MERINAIFPEDFLRRLTAVSREAHISRSELIRKAVLDYLERYERQRREEARRQAIDQAIAVQDALRKKAGSWDGVREVRRWRDARSA